MPEVSITGEIKGGYGFKDADLFCGWKFFCSNSCWRLLEGDEFGRSWLCERKIVDERLVWNEPFEATFACSSLIGWPQLSIRVYRADKHKRIDLAGYAVVHVPASPGNFSLEVPVWRPRGSLCEWIHSLFLGGYPRYECPDVVRSGMSRFGHRVISTGVVEIEINVTLKGFNVLPHVRTHELAVDNDLCESCPDVEKARVFPQLDS